VIYYKFTIFVDRPWSKNNIGMFLLRPVCVLTADSVMGLIAPRFIIATWFWGNVVAVSNCPTVSAFQLLLIKRGTHQAVGNVIYLLIIIIELGSSPHGSGLGRSRPMSVANRHIFGWCNVRPAVTKPACSLACLGSKYALLLWSALQTYGQLTAFKYIDDNNMVFIYVIDMPQWYNIPQEQTVMQDGTKLLNYDWI